MNFSSPNSNFELNRSLSKGAGSESIATHMAKEINEKLDEMGITHRIDISAVSAAGESANTPPTVSESLQTLLNKDQRASQPNINIQL